MKFLPLAVLATAMLSNYVYADNNNTVTDYVSTAPFLTTFVPTSGIMMCAAEGAPAKCTDYMSTIQVLTTTGTIALLKEDMQAVRPDAYDFLAGEPLSLALEAQMERVRQEIPDAQKMTDEEVALLMLQIADSK